MRPVRILGFRKDPKATLGRDIILLIDRQPLVDLLAAAIPRGANVRPWKEKKNVRVVTEALARSVEASGDYELLTCSHCAIPEDILLSAVRVSYEDNDITWEIKPPGADLYFSEYALLALKFHRPQYEKAIRQIIAADPRSPVPE